MYSNNFTCKYVYTNIALSPFNGTNPEIIIKLPPQSVRAPTVKIELMSAKIITDSEYTAIVIKMDEPSDNYYSADFKGPALGIVDVVYTRNAGATFHYALGNDNHPAFNIPSSTQSIKVRFEESTGAVCTPGDFTAYAFIFKLSYPVQDEIQNQFMNQINTGF
jgi:hypothetical protein